MKYNCKVTANQRSKVDRMLMASTVLQAATAKRKISQEEF